MTPKLHRIFIFLTLALSASLSGCASFYLHNAATQKSTDSAKTALDSLKVEALFDSESSYLNTLQSTESAAVTAKYAAERNHEVLLFLSGTGPGGQDGLSTLHGRIDGYLSSLVGATDTGCDVKWWRIIDIDPATVYDSTADLTRFDAQMTQQAANVKKCQAPGVLTLPVPSPTPNLHTATQTVLTDLAKISSDQQEAMQAQTTLKAALADAQSKLSGGKTSAGVVASDLKQLQTALSSANPLVKQIASKALSEQVSAIINALNPTAQKTDAALTQQERSGIAVMQALFGVGDAFSSPPKVPHPNALAATQSWLNYVAFQASADLQNQQTLLRDHQGQLAAVMTAVYYLSKAGEAYGQIKSRHVRNLSGTEGLADLIDSSDGALTRAIDASLLYYSSAWTRGFTVDEVLSRRGYIDQRKIKLASSRAAGEAWLGTLKPAVETLASYGAGGFDPQIVAQLIQALGVAGIAAGVNR